jgi:hypothetical protein
MERQAFISGILSAKSPFKKKVTITKAASVQTVRISVFFGISKAAIISSAIKIIRFPSIR